MRPGLRRRLGAALPAGADARRAPDRRLRAAADPHRQVGLHRLGRDGGAGQAVVLAGEVDACPPATGGARSPAPRRSCGRACWCRVQRCPFRRARAADAEGRQQAALRQHVDGGALLGDQHRIAHGQRHHVHAELEAPRAPRQRGHRRHALQHRLAAQQPIRLPDRSRRRPPRTGRPSASSPRTPPNGKSIRPRPTATLMLTSRLR